MNVFSSGSTATTIPHMPPIVFTLLPGFTAFKMSCVSFSCFLLLREEKAQRTIIMTMTTMRIMSTPHVLQNPLEEEVSSSPSKSAATIARKLFNMSFSPYRFYVSRISEKGPQCKRFREGPRFSQKNHFEKHFSPKDE